MKSFLLTIAVVAPVVIGSGLVALPAYAAAKSMPFNPAISASTHDLGAITSVKVFEIEGNSSGGRYLPNSNLNSNPMVIAAIQKSGHFGASILGYHQTGGSLTVYVKG